MTEIIFPHVLSCLSSDFQFGSERKIKHVKIECIGLKPNRRRRTRLGGAMVGRGPIEEVGRPTVGSARGPLHHMWSLIHYFPNFMIFAIESHFDVVVCLPHTCFSVYLFYTTCGDKHISKIEIESR
jgi:hypothetical protein